MEGNPIISVIMLCTMICTTIWPVFAATAWSPAPGLAFCHQWIAAGPWACQACGSRA